VRFSLINWAAVVTVVTLSAGLSAGCGGGGGDRAYSVEAATTMITADNLDKAEFISRINRICRREWSVIVNVRRYHGLKSNSPRQRFAEAVRIPLMSGIDFLIFDSIRLLGSPPGEERKIEAIVGPMQYAVETAQKQSPPRLFSTADVERHFSEYNRRARRYGLEDCLVNRAHLRGLAAEVKAESHP
jgi:hypothetical protein